MAIVSATGILLVCFFHTTGAYNGCFCSSITFDKGRDSISFPTLNHVIGPKVFRVWIGGFVMSFSTALLFGFSIYLGTPPRR